MRRLIVLAAALAAAGLATSASRSGQERGDSDPAAIERPASTGAPTG